MDEGAASPVTSGARRRHSFVPDGLKPACLFRQSQDVASPMPALRQTLPTAVPSSACLETEAICASVNLDAFMPSLRFRPNPKIGAFQLEPVQEAGSRPYCYEILPRPYGQFLAHVLYRWEIIVCESAIFGILGVRTLGFHVDAAISELRLDVAAVLIVATGAVDGDRRGVALAAAAAGGRPASAAVGGGDRERATLAPPPPDSGRRRSEGGLA